MLCATVLAVVLLILLLDIHDGPEGVRMSGTPASASRSREPPADRFPEPGNIRSEYVQRDKAHPKCSSYFDAEERLNIEICK